MLSFSEMNKVTWYSRLLSILFIFGVFPTIVFFVGKRYQETVTVIIKAEKAQAVSLSNNVFFANSASGPAAIIENNNILGEWISNQDGKYVMKVNNSNIYYEFYEGKVVSSGSWILRSNLPNEKIGSQTNGIFLQKVSVSNKGEENVLYKVEFLDNSRMTLNFLENGAALSFSKISSSTATSSKGR